MATTTSGSSSLHGARTFVQSQRDNLGRPVVVRSTTTVPNQIIKFWYRASENTPGFVGRQRRREILPHNTYLYHLEKSEGIHGHVTAISREGRPDESTSQTIGFMSGTEWNFNSPGTYAFEVDKLRDEAVRRCELKLLERVKDERLNLANIAAERAQTINLFTQTAVKLTSAVVNLKRGNFAAAAAGLGLVPGRQTRNKRDYAKDRAKAIANAWIEYQYGWKPLIEDCKTAVNMLSTVETALAWRHVKARDVVTEEKTILVPLSAQDWKNTTVHKIRVEASARVLFEVPNEFSHALAGVGLTNPLSPLWELTPWSFVVDWFIPIGRTIAALDATLGLKFKAGSVTTFTSISSVRTTNLDWYDGSQVRYSGDIAGSREEVTIFRKPYQEFPSVPWPPFKSPVSLPHALNALALAVQRVK